MVETFIQSDFRFPTQFGLSLRDVRTTHLWIVAGQRFEHQFALAANLLQHQLSQLQEAMYSTFP